MSDKIWNKEDIREGLRKSDKWVQRAILAIYERQTTEEKNTEDTRYRNGVGFNAADARRLSYYANYIKRKGGLTGEHKEIARKKILKYSSQLAKIANREI